MNRLASGTLIALLAATVSPACSSADGKTADHVPAPIAPIAIAAEQATEQSIARFIRATGSLMAEDQADVVAETAGRVVETPVERGIAVSQGSR